MPHAPTRVVGRPRRPILDHLSRYAVQKSFIPPIAAPPLQTDKFVIPRRAVIRRRRLHRREFFIIHPRRGRLETHQPDPPAARVNPPLPHSRVGPHGASRLMIRLQKYPPKENPIPATNPQSHHRNRDEKRRPHPPHDDPSPNTLDHSIPRSRPCMDPLRINSKAARENAIASELGAATTIDASL